MVIKTDETINRNKNKDDALKARLKTIELFIDGELRANAERLGAGREVMVPLQMPPESYDPLLRRYRKNGWIIRHEKVNVFGRFYFSNKK